MKNRHLKKLFLITLFSVGNMLFCMAQSGHKVTGRVMDTKNELLIGVNVMEVGTTNGAVTDINGTYIIHLTTQDPVLRFTYVGFKEREVQVGKQGIIDIFLEEETEALEEVVLLAMGLKRRFR